MAKTKKTVAKGKAMKATKKKPTKKVAKKKTAKKAAPRRAATKTAKKAGKATTGRTTAKRASTSTKRMKPNLKAVASGLVGATVGGIAGAALSDRMSGFNGNADKASEE